MTFSNENMLPSAALSPAGEVYTITPGGAQTNSIAKLDPASGRAIYTVTLAGTYDAGIAFDSADNVYVTGTAATNFNTTARAYRSVAPGDHAAFVCKLGPANGVIQYCTFLDTTGDGIPALDGAGSVSVVFGPNSPGSTTTGALNAGKNIYVEKLNPTGTGLVYAASFGGSSTDYPQAATADAAGTLYITGRTYSADFPTTPNAAVAMNPLTPASAINPGTSFAVRLNSTGSAFLYSTLGALGEQGLAIALDSSGEAEVLEQDSSPDLFLRRYKADGLGIVFETRLNVAYSQAVGEIPQMAIDSVGVTTVIGVNNSIAFPAYEAVQACQFTVAQGYANGFLIRVDPWGYLSQSTWLQGPDPTLVTALSVSSSSAFELVSGINEIDLLTLAPQKTPAPINLACIGNAATLTGAPLAPGEIVSLFGTDIGPVTPQSAQLGSNQKFPTSISNTEVTFDGIAAPLLYVSATQINAVTPFSLRPNGTTHVCVIYEGTTTNCIAAGVSAAAPGVFLNPARPGMPPR